MDEIHDSIARVAAMTSDAPDQASVDVCTVETVNHKVRAMADSGSAEGKALTPEILTPLKEALHVETDGGARKAYDAWRPIVERVLDRKAKRRMVADAANAEPPPEAAMPPPDLPGTDSVPGGGDTGEPTAAIDAIVRRPRLFDEPPPEAAPEVAVAGEGEPPLPEFMRGDLTDSGVDPDAPGAELAGEGAPPVVESTPPLPGMEPTRLDAPPVATLPEQGLQLTPPEVKAETHALARPYTCFISSSGTRCWIVLVMHDFFSPQ